MSARNPRRREFAPYSPPGTIPGGLFTAVIKPAGPPPPEPEPEPRAEAEAGIVTCLVLHIGRARYVVGAIRCEPGDEPEWCYRLTKIGPDPRPIHDVTQYADHVECDCGDFVWRLENTGEGCKHVKALAAVGLVLLPDPTAIGESPFGAGIAD